MVTQFSASRQVGWNPQEEIADGCCLRVRRNIVATVNLDCRLDLKTIALHARNAEYNPKVRASTLNSPFQISCRVGY